MKTTLTLFMILFLGIYLYGQDENPAEIKTLLGGEHSYGGYGAFSIRYNEIDNKEGLSLGGRFGWIIDHNVTLGLGGRGFFTESARYDIPNQLGEEYNLGGGYGGFFIEPIIGARFPVHIAVPIFVGAGGIAFTRKYYDEWDNNSNMDDTNLVDGDAYFFVEPGVELEVNLIRFIRISLGAYYRYTTDIRLEDDFGTSLVDGDILRGLTYGLTIKFGKF